MKIAYRSEKDSSIKVVEPESELWWVITAQLMGCKSIAEAKERLSTLAKECWLH